MEEELLLESGFLEILQEEMLGKIALTNSSK